ncbi:MULTISPECIES: DeoR/GlpR family DNA-binding transcription regulator [Vibrio harveyi group]|uniref:DeoR/GlpR family DNA-binding transcription regulator n=1 Tax=Vibrio harveyi group TaxID=717610 RepID=UPI00215C4C2A|nr:MULTISPECIES: DeoR/GlpR family DNA-binding transcription regulator [Vibrio harveyi group]EGQ8195798.1 DeoR/GlpR transcriptional regulator [Vibrio parahaemolyticus]MCR9998663.1 DeoR/GlpR family DNA-binding transcription regulator [Vibrio alginolyticus]WHT03068.1 DeoR/GlpR family DNA-binding transcription regulator [Vibrio parahaemolyticus]
MFAEERHLLILEAIEQFGKVTVDDLASQFSVTKATIRNDLKKLEAKELLDRTYGGAMSKSKIQVEVNSDSRSDTNKVDKIRIGKKCAALIQHNQVVLLDTGTTTVHIASALKDKKNLTVITNDFEIAKILELFDGIKLYFLGGFVKNQYHCTYHDYYDAVLKTLNVDIAFIGVNAINSQGAFAADISLGKTKRLMCEQATRVVVCCDGDKFNKKSLSCFVDLKGINSIVTNQLPSNYFEYNDIEFVIAE